jgi:hypothetical protein
MVRGKEFQPEGSENEEAIDIKKLLRVNCNYS